MKKILPFLLGLTVFFLIAADSTPYFNSKICGDDEQYCAQVNLVDGVTRLSTDAVVTVDQLFGRDNAASTWVYIGTDIDADGVGAAGDTVRVQIPAAVTPLNLTYPAIDVTTTVTSGCVADPNPERCLALDICSDLNGDADFLKAWKCEVIKDHSGVFISSRLFNEFGERTTWDVTTTGTTIVTKAWDNIIRRGFSTELSRSPNNPRSGILAIAGTVLTTPTADRFFSYFENGTPSNDMQVNCTSYNATTCDFIVNPDPEKEVQIEYISCFGGGNGLKFGQFLSKGGGPLTNGVEIFVRSQGVEFTFPAMKSTEDWKNLFATQAGTDFRIDIQAGGDQFVGSFRPRAPLPLEPVGTVAGGDDFLRVRIQDNLSSGLASFQCAAYGFKKET
jgi:hypothetical protein